MQTPFGNTCHGGNPKANHFCHLLLFSSAPTPHLVASPDFSLSVFYVECLVSDLLNVEKRGIILFDLLYYGGVFSVICFTKMPLDLSLWCVPSHMDIKESNSSLSVDTEKSFKIYVNHSAVHSHIIFYLIFMEQDNTVIYVFS